MSDKAALLRLLRENDHKAIVTLFDSVRDEAYQDIAALRAENEKLDKERKEWEDTAWKWVDERNDLKTENEQIGKALADVLKIIDDHGRTIMRAHAKDILKARELLSGFAPKGGEG